MRKVINIFDLDKEELLEGCSLTLVALRCYDRMEYKYKRNEKLIATVTFLDGCGCTKEKQVHDKFNNLDRTLTKEELIFAIDLKIKEWKEERKKSENGDQYKEWKADYKFKNKKEAGKSGLSYYTLTSQCCGNDNLSAWEMQPEYYTKEKKTIKRRKIFDAQEKIRECDFFLNELLPIRRNIQSNNYKVEIFYY